MHNDETRDQPGRKICPRCQYQRAAVESAPEWQCPNCQIVYAKYNPAKRPSTTENPSKFIVRDERSQGSPLPWIGLILLLLVGGGLYLYDYFHWPDSDKITLFTSDSCGSACSQAVDYLRQQGVEFSEKNIDLDADHRARWERAGGKNIPLAFFGDERIAGYQPTIYQIALTGFKDRMQDNLNQTVILFSAQGCPGCKSAVELLQKHKIEFEEYDIKEPENADVFRELFGRGTPLIFVGNIRLDGYNKKLLEMALQEVELM